MLKIVPFGIERPFGDDLDEGAAMRFIEDALAEVGEVFEIEFEVLIAPWENERPVFRQKGYKIANAVIHTVYPDADAEPMGYSKFLWLDEGTEVRYHIMSDDFLAKSNPNSLNVQPGNTGSPRFTPFPQQGIEPRNWTLLLLLRHRDTLEGALDGAIDNILTLFI